MSKAITLYTGISNDTETENTAYAAGQGLIIGKKFINGKDVNVPDSNPAFASEQELIEFLQRNNIDISGMCNTSKTGEINWLYIAIAATVGMGLGYIIFSK